MSARHQLLGRVVCDKYPSASGAIPGYGRFGSTSTPDPDSVSARTTRRIKHKLKHV